MKIIYQTETGILIIHPTGELPIDVVMVKDVPQKYMHTAIIVDDYVIPTDRTFRNAWKHKEGYIIEDVDIAKEIHKDRLREERKGLLEELDILQLNGIKRVSMGKTLEDIESEKQRLCDITKLVDICESVEDIKKVVLS